MGTDNKANLSLSSGDGAASRMRHAIRRFAVFKQRVAAGDCALRHVPDASNAADYLTKFVSGKKAAECDRYCTGAGVGRAREVPV